MRSEILSRRIRLVAVFIGLALALALFFYFITKNSSPDSSALLAPNGIDPVKPEPASASLPVLPVGRPVRLKIPVINVDSAVEHVGLTSEGAMDVPKNQNDVAWLELGSRPGENGSAVMAGHFGWKNGSVFDDLYKLQPGDKLSIEDDKGLVISFVVRASRSYGSEADAPEVFGSTDGKPHLNLVACEGNWDKTAKSYPKRLVVFTDKVDYISSSTRE